MTASMTPSPRFIRLTRDFRCERDEEHEYRAIQAFRRRKHPAWSQYASGIVEVKAA